MARWRIDWSFAGASGTVYDPDSVTWAEKAAFYARRPSPRSVTVECKLPIDVGALILAGHAPERGQATIYLNDRRFLRGAWSGVEWDEDSTVRFRVGERSIEDTQVFPSSGTVLRKSAEATPATALEIINADEVVIYEGAFYTNVIRESQGKVLPFVIGAPGTSEIPGAPALLSDALNNHLILHGAPPMGYSDALVNSPYGVRLWGPDATGGNSSINDELAAAMSVQEDLQGGQYVRATATGSSIDIEEDGSYYVSYYDETASPPTFYNATYRDAGDVLLYFAEVSSLRFDYGSIHAIRERLSGYKLDGYINAETTPYDVIRKLIVPILPISMRAGLSGIEFVMWPFLDEEAAPRDVRAGPGFRHAGRVKSLDWMVPEPSVEVAYAYNPKANSFSRRYRHTTASSAYAAAGLSRGAGSAGLETIEARLVWDDFTAAQIARDRVRAYGQRPMVIPYAADPSIYGQGGDHPLRAGDGVILTDDTLGISGQRAIVGETEETGTDMRVTMYLRRDLLRD